MLDHKYNLGLKKNPVTKTAITITSHSMPNFNYLYRILKKQIIGSQGTPESTHTTDSGMECSKRLNNKCQT